MCSLKQKCQKKAPNLMTIKCNTYFSISSWFKVGKGPILSLLRWVSCSHGINLIDLNSCGCLVGFLRKYWQFSLEIFNRFANLTLALGLTVFQIYCPPGKSGTEWRNTWKPCGSADLADIVTNLFQEFLPWTLEVIRFPIPTPSWHHTAYL